MSSAAARDPHRIVDTDTLCALYGAPGETSPAQIDGAACDREQPSRVQASLY